LHGWDKAGWKRNFRAGTAKWITEAIRNVGKGGRGGRNTVNPVKLAQGLIELETKLGTNVADLARQLDERFERPPLIEWRALWQRARERL
jgi:hypothetical protein